MRQEQQQQQQQQQGEVSGGVASDLPRPQALQWLRRGSNTCLHPSSGRGRRYGASCSRDDDDDANSVIGLEMVNLASSSSSSSSSFA